MKSKLLILLATSALLATISTVSSTAQPRYAPRCRIVSPGLVVQTSRYQEPNGTYDSYSDYIRDVNGTPCGVECSHPWRRVVWFASPPGYACF
jgi:hypothetical protein